jgi:integrase
MASIVTRASKAGVKHYLYAHEDGRKKYIGAFGTREEAEVEKLKVEAQVAMRRTGHRDAPTAYAALQTLRDYFYDESPQGYRARTSIEPATWLDYETSMRRHVLPYLGHRAVNSIKREDVRALVGHPTGTLKAAGVGAATIERARKVLSTVYKTLIDHDVVGSNPAYQIKTPPVTREEKPICTLEEMKALVAAFPTDGARLLCGVLIQSGMRYGEAIELRPKDIDWRTGTVTVSRAVADIGDKENPDGTGRFYVKTTKGGKSRFTSVTDDLLASLEDFVEKHKIGRNDLLFTQPLVVPDGPLPEPPPPAIQLTPELIDTLGLTEPNAQGRRYRHGTSTGYTTGRCRCEYCKQAIRDLATQRAKKKRKAHSNGTRTNKTGHLPRDAWYRLWYQACTDAGIPYHVAPHSLRHSHATWILKSGQYTIHDVKERLGHASITTTEVYLHRIKAEDQKSKNVLKELYS